MQKKKQQGANFNDVLIKGLDVFHDLINSGNIFGFFALIILIIVLALSLRLPSESLDSYLRNSTTVFIQFLQKEKFYLIPLLALLAVSLKANYSQHKHNQRLRKEISRLAEQRKEIMHGLKQGTMKTLPDHHSSDFELDN